MLKKNFAFQQKKLSTTSLQEDASSSLYKLHKTSLNPKLIEKYFDASGNLKTNELQKTLKKAFFSSERNKFNYIYLANLSKKNPEVYPSPAAVMNWLEKRSWQDVLCFINGSAAKPSNSKYTNEFLEKWMDLIVAYFRKENKNDFSVLDYQKLTLDDLSDIFTDEEIEYYIGRADYDRVLYYAKMPSLPTITKQLGKFNEIKIKRKMEIKRIDLRWNVSQEKLLQMLIKEVTIIKKLPSHRYLKQCERLPSYGTFYNCFNTKNWNNILNYLIEELEKQGLSEYIITDDIKNKAGLILPENKQKKELANGI